MLCRGLKARKEATELGEPGGAPVGADERSRRRLVCSGCAHAITSVDERIEMRGQHAHTCVNPAGVVFRIGCFRRAEGVTGRGPRVSEHSWFAGYAWQVGLCRGCGAHLGWAFHGGPNDPFWGLILDRLEERDD